MMADQLARVIVTLTLVEMMATIGLGVTIADFAGVARNWQLVGRAALANYVCMPAATIGLLVWFDANPLVSAGFMILAVSPGAPFGPPFAAIAKGNVGVAVGLMVILAGSSALLAPVMLRYSVPLLGGESLTVDATKILTALLATQLLPLCAGIAIRQCWPRLAERLQRPAGQLGKVLNLVTIGLILTTQFHLLTQIRPRGLVGMFALLLASWSAGWLLGSADPSVRRTMILTTSLRNVGVGLVIATGSFSGTPAVTAVLVYGLVEVLGSLLLALWWGRRPEVRWSEPQTVASG